ncbi:hypothetical protein, partial [Mycolicibacterium insubricum]|uniref:hypothetical protein n=1 Tax=Mycolicibacterium insubricum TaxID=444597 RepID=UPI0021F28521
MSILADEHRVDDATAGTDELAALDDLLANPAVRALTLVARGRLALADDRADAGHRLLAQALAGADDPGCRSNGPARSTAPPSPNRSHQRSMASAPRALVASSPSRR